MKTLILLMFAARCWADTNPPVAEANLQTQDFAFSLLIETYRQFQNNLIEFDYENRRCAANSLTNGVARQEAIGLAEQERELRVRKLCVQLGSLGLSYDYSRKNDERNEGLTVPHQVNTDAAAEELKDFIVVVPSKGNKPSTSIPADAVLRDQPPGRPPR